ncbi:hypothetical protein BZG17_25550, partial [Escherichia coli]|nr:hypothetical protein [Escherichia coli]
LLAFIRHQGVAWAGNFTLKMLANYRLGRTASILCALVSRSCSAQFAGSDGRNDKWRAGVEKPTKQALLKVCVTGGT